MLTPSPATWVAAARRHLGWEAVAHPYPPHATMTCGSCPLTLSQLFEPWLMRPRSCSASQLPWQRGNTLHALASICCEISWKLELLLCLVLAAQGSPR
jgi:hypothetical protein